MAEEFHPAGICGGSRWINSSRNSQIIGGSSPCSMENAGDHHLGAYGYGSWMDLVDLKTAWSCKETSIANPVLSDSSMAFPSSHKPPHHQQANSDGAGSTIFTDSTLQMMGFGLSSSSSSSLEWVHALLRGSGRAESYNPMVHQEDMNSGLNSTQIQKEWSPKSFTSTSEDSSINALKAINHNFSLDQQRLNPINSSGNSISTCQGLPTGFSMDNISATYGYPSPLVQGLFEPDPPQPQQVLFNNCPTSMNYSSSAAPNYGINLNDLSSSWPNIAPLPKQEPSSLHFSNNTPFWNASATRTGGVLDSPPRSQPLVPTLEGKLKCPNLATKPNNEDARGSGSVGKKGSEPAFKRPRIETPSPLPTFKVRKEKLGDRITALQQLVSPFGKTDTASVLNEAFEYIKFLHDQVNVLSTPYMKNGNPTQNHQQVADKSKMQEALKEDLRSRGLCLVPISSTFPVARETTADFWTPTFGGTFR